MSNDISTATCLDVDIGKQQVFLHGYATYGTKPYSALIATDKSWFAEGHNLLFIIDDNLVGEHGIAIARHPACCKLVGHFDRILSNIQTI